MARRYGSSPRRTTTPESREALPGSGGAEPDLFILYDEGCGLCRATVGLILMVDRRRRMGAMSFTEAERRGLTMGLTPEALRRSWHAVDRRGRRVSGGAVLAPVLERLPGGRPPARLARMAPGLMDRLYHAVADRRGAVGTLVPARLRRRAERELRRRA